MKKSRPKIIVILGPTASGKTKLAVKLANKFDGEIISADSRQVYRDMTIGTGKDLADYRVKTRNTKHETRNKVKKYRTTNIPYHLINVVNPKTTFNVAKWLKLANKAIADILNRGKIPFVVGGTGLYIYALVEGYNLAGTKPNLKLRKKLEKQSLDKLLARLRKLDLITYKKIDKKNKRRVARALEICLLGKTPASCLQGRNKPNFDFLILGIAKPREEIIKLIDKRVDVRLDQGMVKEVKQLHNPSTGSHSGLGASGPRTAGSPLRSDGVSWKRLESFGLEYRWIARYLQNKIKQEEMIEGLKIATHQFSKRQMTWFRRVENVKWVKNYKEAHKIIQQILAPASLIRV